MSQNHIDELHDLLAPIFQRNRVVRASVFGSHARGEQRNDSDYDFLVEFEKGVGWEYFGLPTELEEVLKRKVDIITP